MPDLHELMAEARIYLGRAALGLVICAVLIGLINPALAAWDRIRFGKREAPR